MKDFEYFLYAFRVTIMIGLVLMFDFWLFEDVFDAPPIATIVGGALLLVYVEMLANKHDKYK